MKIDPHALLHFVGTALCVVVAIVLGAVPHMFPMATAEVLQYVAGGWAATGVLHGVAQAVIAAKARASTASPLETEVAQLVAKVGLDAAKAVLSTKTVTQPGVGGS